VTSSLFVEVFPHVIFAAEIPAAWEMIEFLMLSHIFKSFQTSSADIKINGPIVSFLQFLNTVVFEGVNDALIL